MFLVLSAIITALLYYPPIPTRSEPGKTSGEIIFTPQGGIIEVSGAEGASSGPSTANRVTWSVGNAIIKYTVNNVSVGLQIAGDSPNGRVVIEEKSTMPESVKKTVPGTPVKYVGLSQEDTLHTLQDVFLLLFLFVSCLSMYLVYRLFIGFAPLPSS
ncbi:MAG: hypothetical protein Q8P40_04310 [Nitrospirota bacterium]|nr:hypothetical protein [Nitrospirota bacterium]